MIELATFCGLLSAAILLMGRYAQRHFKRARIYYRRPVLPLASIWQAHFAPLGLGQEICEESWLRLSRTFGVNPGALRVSDRFDGELHHLDHLLDGWLLLVITIAESDHTGLKPEQIETVGDFMRLAAQTRPDASLLRKI
jgi:hypothetical protein